MPLESKLDRPKSLTDLAVERIRAAIVEGGLASGSSFRRPRSRSTSHLQDSPVREALLRPGWTGWSTSSRSAGTFVFTLDADEVKSSLRSARSSRPRRSGSRCAATGPGSSMR